MTAALSAAAGAVLAQTPTSGLGPLPHPPVEYSALGPVLVLVGGAMLLLTVAALFRSRLVPGFHALVTVLTAGVALAWTAWLWGEVGDGGARTVVAGSLALDGFAVFFTLVVCASVALGALVADSYLRREGLDGPEFYVLMLLSAAGGILMASANDLVVVFLGIETLSISLFVLAGFHRRRAESGEAAMKYFVLSAFSSAFLLYGIALVYGATGSTNLVSIAQWLAENVSFSRGVLTAGTTLLLVGFGFKVAAVPFHTWTPDVYQGSPTPVTAFMAGASKAAGFAALLRVFFSTFRVLSPDWRPIVWAVAVVTLVVGSVVAVVQSDIKRMLAYSSISHAGYILVGLQAASTRGVAGSLFYVLAYTFMVMGSFAIVTLVARRGDAEHSLETYRGLYARRPGLALAFTVFLMAQAGVPFTSGFLAKFYVISAAVERRSYALAIIAMLAAVVAAFFYLRVIVLMFSPPDGDAPLRPVAVPLPAGAALAVTVGFTLLAGILPAPFLNFARDATLLF